MERIKFDLLFRWFVGLGIDDPVWDHSSFSTNRDRLLDGEIAAKFLASILSQPRVKRLLSSQHFSVDGTLIEAWASLKSFKPKDQPSEGDDDASGGGRNRPADFRGEKRSNAPHHSTTDPDARLYRKGPGMEAKLCFMGHGLMENRSGLIVDARLTRVSGYAERLAALEMVEHVADHRCAITLGADRGYDAADFVEELRTLNVRPRVAQNTSGRRSAIDKRTTRHSGYGQKPAGAQTHRGSLGLDQDGRRPPQDQAQRAGKSGLGLHLCRRGLQPRTSAKAGWRGMSGPAGCEVIGRWRIVASNLWDREYLDLARPAYLQVGAGGRAEFSFGALTATAELEYGRRVIFFHWSGVDEGDAAGGDGSAELQDNGSLEVELSFDDGDDAILTAHRETTSSTAC